MIVLVAEKNAFFRRDFGRLRTSIENVSGTEQDIDNRKTAFAKMKKKKSRDASRSSRRDGDDRRVGPRGDADATSGAHQRGASLKGASKEGVKKFNSEVECLSEVSDVERSDTEYTVVPRT